MVEDTLVGDQGTNRFDLDKPIVQLIGCYTGERVLFTVDTRLRPNGTAGLLVQTEAAVLDYFAVTAEAWESSTYEPSVRLEDMDRVREDVLMERSGGVCVAAALAKEFGVSDIDGKQPVPLTLEMV